VKLSVYILSVVALCAATAARAGDAEAGRQLAQSRCAACHAVGHWQGDVVAAAPPFEVLARKFPGGTTDLIIALRGPHRMMNFRPTQSEADDIAAYIRSLAP